MMTGHNLLVARNSIVEEVSFKVNEYSVSQNTLNTFLLMSSIKIKYQFFTANNMEDYFLQSL